MWLYLCFCTCGGVTAIKEDDSAKDAVLSPVTSQISASLWILLIMLVPLVEEECFVVPIWVAEFGQVFIRPPGHHLIIRGK